MAGHPVQRGMSANLGSLDRVYESWPPPGGGRGYGTKRRRWCGGTGVPGGHDTHRPFSLHEPKGCTRERHSNSARVGRPIPFRARSAQGPVHFPPTCDLARDGVGMSPRPARAGAEGEGGGRDGRQEREGAGAGVPPWVVCSTFWECTELSASPSSRESLGRLPWCTCVSASARQSRA